MRRTRESPPKPPAMSATRCWAGDGAGCSRSSARPAARPCPWRARPRRCGGWPRPAPSGCPPGRSASRAGLAAQELGQQRDGHEDQPADRRRDADQGMEQEADRQIERHPRQIEQRRRAHGRHERTDTVEIVQRLVARRRQRLQRQLGGDIVDALAQRLVDRARDPHQDAAADDVEKALEAEHDRRQDADADQGGDAAARDDPVVDFEHEDRPGQLQHVEHGAEQADADQGVAAIGQRRRQGRPGAVAQPAMADSGPRGAGFAAEGLAAAIEPLRVPVGNVILRAKTAA